MSRFLIFFALILILFYTNKQQNNFTLKNYFDGEYTSYSNNPISSTSIDLGCCFLNYSDVKQCELLGESISVDNLEVATALSDLKAKVVKTEFLNDGTTVIYAYSPLINNKVTLNCGAVNLQFALKENHTIIGWPLILGSFWKVCINQKKLLIIFAGGKYANHF